VLQREVNGVVVAAAPIGSPMSARATECMPEHQTTHAVVADAHRSQRAVGVLSEVDSAKALVEGVGR
jgi:hypothetical protein